MEVIYVIKQAFYNKESETYNEFKNLYAVKDEITARNDCRTMQIISNKENIDVYFKWVYKYEVLKLFPF